jgi:antitoxin component of MazEF toxin-antitoxin module
MTIKARKVGNSITLTIPKGIKIADGTEFTVEQRDDGAILYLPKHRNPFEGNWYKQKIRQKDVMVESEVLPSEWD